MLATVASRVLIGMLLYLCVATIMFFVGFTLLRGGVVTELPWLHAIQSNLYHGGVRNIWQNQPGCVVFDEQVLYRPKDGACAFTNAEFDTVLNFSNGERVHKPIAGGQADIAVVGDSFAMGWGVNDHETFSALLQERLGRTVHNLAVSSYGTVRELIALEGSPFLTRIDTVVIQYSDNDIDENVNFKASSAEERRAKFGLITSRGQTSFAGQLPFLYAGYRYALKVPFGGIKRLWKVKLPPDFLPHYGPLMATIAKHISLKDKRVIVFYSNGHGAPFRNYPDGPAPELANVRFVDLGIGRENYFILDDHLTAKGHQFVAEKLARIISSP